MSDLRRDKEKKRGEGEEEEPERRGEKGVEGRKEMRG